MQLRSSTIKQESSKKNIKRSRKIKEKDDKKLIDTFKPVKPVAISMNIKYNAIDIPRINEILKEFDLNMNYGPIIGISRTDRFKRAEYFELPLKDETKAILKDRELLKKYPELDLNIWHDIERDTFTSVDKY